MVNANIEIAQGQLDAYNAQNLDAHVAFFAEDMSISNLREAPNLSGIAAYRERMAGVFAQFPDNKVELLNRIVLGNKVLDHEKVIRSPDATPFEVVAVYSIENGKIANVDFVK
jgi:hypothetical protein